MALKKGVRLGLMGLGVIGGFFALQWGWNTFVPKPAETSAVTLEQNGYTAKLKPEAVEPHQVEATTERSSTGGQCVDMEVLPWNGIGALAFANGGARTQPGSLVDKYTGGGCINLVLQTDYAQMEANLASGKDKFIVIMGDGYPYVSLAMNNLPFDGFEAVGVIGFSNGEDQCMGPAAAAKDKQKLKGTLIAAVPLDGDWNICVKVAADNGILINADPKTYDPGAINFIDTTTFEEADEKIIAHYCEDRKLVSNGFDQGRTVKVCVNGVATWTPGDVEVVKNYDGYANDMDGNRQAYGITTIASTRDYSGQMPTLIIGRKDFNAAHRDLIVGLLKAVDQGAAAINGSNGACANGFAQNAALMRMGAIHAQIFKSKDKTYWAKYFCGTTDTDQLGNQVRLGGSRVVGLSQQATYFGLLDGTQNMFKTVYDTFGGYDVKLRKDLQAKVLPYDEIVNLEYLQEALQGVKIDKVAAAPTFSTTTTEINNVVSNRVYKIEFDTGRATIRDESLPILNELAGQAGMTGLRLRIDGYTDNTGSSSTNEKLSRDRAQAVADWLTQTYPTNFPTNRMQANGHGPQGPIASNATAEGRQQNRRVEIAFGE